jgi:hypothetical protein
MPAITSTKIATTRRRRLPSSGTSPSIPCGVRSRTWTVSLKVGRQSHGKRRYVKLRIPESIVRAVYEELTGPI